MRSSWHRSMYVTLMTGVALVTASPLASGAEKAADQGARVVVAQATEACFSKTVHGTGFLMPRGQAVVTMEVAGYQVTEVLAHAGERVSAGQALARLSHVGPVAPGQDMPSVVVLRAPAAGKIEQSTATIGAVASPKGDPLFRIATSDEIEMDAEVPSMYLDEVAVGQTAHVYTASGHVDGRVRLIASNVDPQTQLGHVRVSLAPDPSLHIGSFVRATIDAGKSCGVSVPKTAVLYGTEGTSVQVIRGRVVERHMVRIGLLSDHDAEIKAGVQRGDIVVAHAGTSLRDGDVVSVLINEEPGPAGQH